MILPKSYLLLLMLLWIRAVILGCRFKLLCYLLSQRLCCYLDGISEMAAARVKSSHLAPWFTQFKQACNVCLWFWITFRRSDAMFPNGRQDFTYGARAYHRQLPPSCGSPVIFIRQNVFENIVCNLKAIWYRPSYVKKCLLSVGNHYNTLPYIYAITLTNAVLLRVIMTKVIMSNQGN